MQLHHVKITHNAPLANRKHFIDTLFQPDVDQHTLYFLSSAVSDKSINIDTIYTGLKVENKKIMFMERVIEIKLSYYFEKDLFILEVDHSYTNNDLLKTILEKRIERALC